MTLFDLPELTAKEEPSDLKTSDWYRGVVRLHKADEGEYGIEQMSLKFRNKGDSSWPTIDMIKEDIGMLCHFDDLNCVRRLKPSQCITLSFVAKPWFEYYCGADGEDSNYGVNIVKHCVLKTTRKSETRRARKLWQIRGRNWDKKKANDPH